MEQFSRSPRSARFGVFEVDLRAGELRKQGIKINLQEQPFQVLATLLERPGDLVTREELIAKLWPDGTIVDFDHCINIAIQKLRQALTDSAENPRFIETLSGRGYRLIVAVNPPSPAPPGGEAGRWRRFMERAWGFRGGLAALAVVLAVVGYEACPPPPQTKIMMVVLAFENLSGDPEQEYFSDGLTDEITAQLGGLNPERLGVIAYTTAMKYKRTTKDVKEIGRELGVQFVLEGTVRRAGGQVCITAQLIEVSDQTHVWAAKPFERDQRNIFQ
jgi:TolB-like protein/DNA-binding winged helix-turn-helix (wHTH) protein